MSRTGNHADRGRTEDDRLDPDLQRQGHESAPEPSTVQTPTGERVPGPDEAGEPRSDDIGTHIETAEQLDASSSRPGPDELGPGAGDGPSPHRSEDGDTPTGHEPADEPDDEPDQRPTSRDDRGPGSSELD